MSYFNAIKILSILIYLRSVRANGHYSEKMETAESNLLQELLSRVDNRQRVVTGTFRFKRVSPEFAGPKSPNGGWDIEGCYCETGHSCSCSGNKNRVRMFVKAGTKSNRGGSGSDDFPEPPFPSEDSDDSERERERIRAPPSNGCFCNSNACTGNACATLNGCVCNSTGTCWGAACSARVPTMTVAPIMAAPQVTQPITVAPASGQLIVQPQPVIAPAITAPNLLTNSLQAVRNALVAPLQTMSVNGQQVQLQPGLAGNQGECTCNQNGCVGTGCANLNGCFCVGQNCWGNACQTSIASTQQQQQSGRLVNGQAGNFIDIPGLFGGGGGGTNFEGQTIPVVQGIPITRLTGQRARRLRGGRGRGSMALSSGRVRSRVRPQPIMKKRMKTEDELQDIEETTNDRRTRTEEEYGVHFDNDFLPFKTEVTKETLPSLQEDFDSVRDDQMTRHQRFAEKLQKSLAKFWTSNPVEEDNGETESPDRRQDNEPLVFAEDVLNVNILTLDEDNDFATQQF